MLTAGSPCAAWLASLRPVSFERSVTNRRGPGPPQLSIRIEGTLREEMRHERIDQLRIDVMDGRSKIERRRKLPVNRDDRSLCGKLQVPHPDAACEHHA